MKKITQELIKNDRFIFAYEITIPFEIPFTLNLNVLYF